MESMFKTWHKHPCSTAWVVVCLLLVLVLALLQGGVA